MITAVAIGTDPPAVQSVRVQRAATLTEALARADSGRLWLLGPDAVPAGDALAPLISAADATGAPLVSSLPVDATGALVEGALPRGDEAGTERLLSAVGRGLVPIKLAPLTSLLVDVTAARAVAAPEPERFGPFSDLAWTGRLLEEGPGYLVLASRVQVCAPARPALTALPAVREMRRARLWTRGETLRMAARVRPAF